MLVSAVGGGPWAIPVRAELERLGISLFDLAAGTAYETPLTTVLVNAANSSRTIVNPPIAPVVLRQLGDSWGVEMPASWGAIPPVVLCDGFHLQQVLPFLAACRDAGAALCLDGGSWKPGTAELAPLLTAAICSERFSVPVRDGTVQSDYGQPCSGQPHPSISSAPDALFEWFASRGVPYIAITRGGKPVLGGDRGRRFEIEVEKIAAADTLGAGDVLHGAFCHFFAQDQVFEPALRKASELATLSCQSLGIQAWATQTGCTKSRP
jgi:sugar/nucleoside kinase (ribokinase family)